MTDSDAALTEAMRFRRLRVTHETALRDALFAEHLWLVQSIVASYVKHRRIPAGWERADVAQEGSIGLMVALDKFDPDGRHQGIRFPTVAAWYIRKSIQDAVSDAMRQADIAEQPTIPMRIITPLQPPTWLQDRITRELEALPSNEPSVEETVMAQVDGVQLSAALEAALLLLSDQQRFIITRRFGLGADGETWTCARIGMAIGRHKSNVSRSATKALAALRAQLAASGDGALVLRELETKRAQGRKVAA